MDDSEEELTCRFCYEEFERDQLIVPCKCRGTGKFVCKECLVRCTSMETNEAQFTMCPTCKTRYKRETADYTNSINEQVKDVVLIKLGINTIALILFLLLGMNTAVFVLMLLILYMITVTYLLVYDRNHNMVVGLWVVFAILMFAPHRISYYGYFIWCLALYGVIDYYILDQVWKKCSDGIYRQLIKNKKVRMFDFDLEKYVNVV